MVSSTVWLGWVVAGCTTGTTPNCGGDAGCGPGFDGPAGEGSLSDESDSPSDAPSDAPSESTSDAPVDVTQDAPPDSTSDGPSGEAGDACHKNTGGGKLLECDFESGMASCPAGFKPGTCPSKNLAGCCVTVAGGTTTATCYYTSDVPPPSVDMTACTTAGNTWVTTAP